MLCLLRSSGFSAIATRAEFRCHETTMGQALAMRLLHRVHDCTQ